MCTECVHVQQLMICGFLELKDKRPDEKHVQYNQLTHRHTPCELQFCPIGTGTVRGEAATGGAVGSVCFSFGKHTAEQTPRPACSHSCTSRVYTVQLLGASHPLSSPRSNAVKR